MPNLNHKLVTKWKKKKKKGIIGKNSEKQSQSHQDWLENLSNDRVINGQRQRDIVFCQAATDQQRVRSRSSKCGHFRGQATQAFDAWRKAGGGDPSQLIWRWKEEREKGREKIKRGGTE